MNEVKGQGQERHLFSLCVDDSSDVCVVVFIKRLINVSSDSPSDLATLHVDCCH